MIISNEKALDILIKAVDRAGGVVKFADIVGVSSSLISLVMSGKRSMNDDIAAALGLRRVIMWDKE
jgi:hypothetical protein